MSPQGTRRDPPGIDREGPQPERPERVLPRRPDVPRSERPPGPGLPMLRLSPTGTGRRGSPLDDGQAPAPARVLRRAEEERVLRRLMDISPARCVLAILQQDFLDVMEPPDLGEP